MKKPYLVQRGNFREKIATSMIKGVDSVVEFDYMGSAEFEFGAKFKSLRRLVNRLRQGSLTTETVIINDTPFFLLRPMDASPSEIRAFLEEDLVSRAHTKEPMYFSSFFLPKAEQKFYSPELWWDLENDWIVAAVNQGPNLSTAFDNLAQGDFGREASEPVLEVLEQKLPRTKTFSKKMLNKIAHGYVPKV